MDSPAGTAMLSMASYVYHTQELNLDQEGSGGGTGIHISSGKLVGKIPPSPLRQASSHDALTQHSPLSQSNPMQRQP